MWFMADELLDIAGISLDNIGYRYVNLGGRAVFVMGYNEILQFNNDWIILGLSKKRKIHIKGVDLSIKEMDKTSLLISGYVSVVEVS